MEEKADACPKEDSAFDLLPQLFQQALSIPWMFRLPTPPPTFSDLMHGNAQEQTDKSQAGRNEKPAVHLPIRKNTTNERIIKNRKQPTKPPEFSLFPAKEDSEEKCLRHKIIQSRDAKTRRPFSVYCTRIKIEKGIDDKAKQPNDWQYPSVPFHSTFLHLYHLRSFSNKSSAFHGCRSAQRRQSIFLI